MKWCVLFCVFVSLVRANSLNGTDMEPCTYQKKRGVCLTLAACKPYLDLLKEGNSTLQGVRVVQEHRCGFDGASARVCCPIDGRASSDDRPLESNATQKEEDDFVDKFPEPPHCGLLQNGIPQARSPDCVNKIDLLLNGKPVYYGISRWMALLGYKNSGLFWQCGGTIITQRHVLTAAHCIKRNLYVVRVGEIDYNDKNRFDGMPADYLIKKKIPHEQYSKFYNDIAVLVLQTDIQFNEYVSPICMPVPNVPYMKIEVDVEEGESGYIEGWGLIENDKKPTHLQFAYVNNLGNDVCRKIYANVTIDDRVLCAGADQTDACKGDSGGPLVWTYCIPQNEYEGADFHYQIGVISFGLDCKKSRFAGVYTSLQYFMPWLEEKVLGKRVTPT